MIQFGIDPWVVTEVNRQHEVLAKQADLERLAKEAFRNESSKTRRIYKILSVIGRDLASFGTNLEARFSIQSNRRSELGQQSNPDGCS
jgi:hypothetical protein